MRTSKRVISFLAAFALLFVACAAGMLGAGCSVVSKSLESISIDRAKTQYFVGDEFDGDIKVTAHYALSDGNSEEADVSGRVAINSSAYKNDTVGDYDIAVSYSDEFGSANTVYKVNVTVKRNGLALSFKDGMGEPINLNAERTTADISAAASWIEVRQPDEFGEVSENSPVLDNDYYTVKVYKGKEEVKDLTAVNRGAYQIWASRYDEEDDFLYEGFIFYYVVDEVQSVTLSGGTVTQPRSLKDKMSASWKFTVTYASGDSVVVDKTNMYLNVPAINANAGQNNADYKGTVKVSYNEPLPNGAAQSKTVDVEYTLTGAKAIPDMAILNADDLTKTDVSVETEFSTFELIKGNINTSVSANITLPTGIEVDGKETVLIGKAWQSGGASSPANGRYINFRASRNFEIYIYAVANGDNDRVMYFSTEDDYSVISNIEGYSEINDIPVAYKSSPQGYSLHAQSVTDVSSDGVDYTVSFGASINVFYILVVFEEE